MNAEKLMPIISSIKAVVIQNTTTQEFEQFRQQLEIFDNIYELIHENIGLDEKINTDQKLSEIILEFKKYYPYFLFKRFDNIFQNCDKEILLKSIKFDVNFSPNENQQYEYIYDDEYYFDYSIQYLKKFVEKKTIRIVVNNNGFLYNFPKRYIEIYPLLWKNTTNWCSLSQQDMEFLYTINSFFQEVQTKLKWISPNFFYRYGPYKNRFDVSIDNGNEMIIICFKNQYPNGRIQGRDLKFAIKNLEIEKRPDENRDDLFLSKIL